MKQVVVIGASGYTGAELVGLLLHHPNMQIAALVAQSNAGKELVELYPHFSGQSLPQMVTLDAVDFSAIDIAFCCLPHGTSQALIRDLPEHVRIIDLSADFRLQDAELYAQWYGAEHVATELQKEAVYGLSEYQTKAIEKARVIACPGCYPTSVLLPLLPLVSANMVALDSIIIDTKTGMSGAGRNARIGNLFAEMHNNIKPYSIGQHRHTAEIEQELSTAAGTPVRVSFTPQVLPMSRGILSCIYVQLNKNYTADDLRHVLQEQHKMASFIQVLSADAPPPATKDVLGTNQCRIGVYADRLEGRAIILSVIDNLTKGASGQAVQNANIACGWDEKMGLEYTALVP